MTSAQDTDLANEGRFARTALLAVLAGSWGAVVFKNVNDAALAAPFFVLTTLTIFSLALELRTQAHRRSPEGTASWKGTDTGIVVVLVGLAAVCSVAVVLRSFSPPEQSANLSFAALYVVLAGLFSWNRRATSNQA